MAITVNVGSNPRVASVGTSAANDVIIYSGRLSTDEVTYEIERRDGQPHWQGKVGNVVGGFRQAPASSRLKITLSTWANTVAARVGLTAANTDVTSISATAFALRLQFRTKYKVRIRWRSVGQITTGSWSAWTQFETRDKHYKTPDAITQEVIGDDTNPTTRRFPNKKTKKRIVVRNGAKSSVIRTARGATVTNSDLEYNGTSSIERTDGARTAGVRVSGRTITRRVTATKRAGRITIVNENYYANKKSGGRGPARRQPV